MSSVIVDPHGNPAIPFMTDNVDGWEDQESDYADAFEPALWLIMEKQDIRMDPTLSKEEQLSNRDIGILSHSFWKWTIHVNWSTTWAQKIPPHHMAVHFNGVLVGIISPFLTIRTCWSCRLGDPTRTPGGQPARNGYDEKWFYITYPGSTIKLPAVYPAHPCPECGAYDWFANTVEIEQFQRDAAEHLAVATGDDVHATDMRVTHDPRGEGKMGYARTKV